MILPASLTAPAAVIAPATAPATDVGGQAGGATGAPSADDMREAARPATTSGGSGPALAGALTPARATGATLRSTGTQAATRSPIQRTSPQAPLVDPELVRRFEALGFRCAGPDPARGLRCIGKLPGYPKPVSIFIPPHFSAAAQANVILHLHGFTLGNSAESEVFGRYDFGSYLAKAQVNAILVVPESDDRVATYNSLWSDDAAATSKNLTAFVDQLSTLLSSTGLVQAGATGRGAPADAIGALVITGHSGAYRPIANLSQAVGPYADKVRAVGLFDASYDLAPRLAEWALRLGASGGLFVDAFVGGSPTDATTREVLRLVEQQRRVTATLSRDNDGSSSLQPGVRFLQEDRKASDGEQHWHVVSQHYVQFLRALVGL
jgi:hypothetical protein